MITRNRQTMRTETTTSRFLLVPMLMLLALTGSPRASGPITTEDVVLSSEKRTAIVHRVADTFEERYVFEDIARKMGSFIRSRLADHGYDSITTTEGLVSQLAEDLRSVSHDRHVKAYPYMEHPVWSDEKLAQQRAQALLESKRENFGFQTVKILPGNIGYVNITQFYDVNDAGPTAIAAMNFLASCEALIIDLRENGGGYTTTRLLILSYLFEEPTHVNDHHDRKGLFRQEWTLPFVNGPKMAGIPLYVLVGRPTFSAAEGFAFALKNRSRATIIGETTAGGAHSVEYFHFPEEGITVRVPTARALDPLTETNWEGSGVEPDIQVPAFEQGLLVANIEALKKMVENEPEGGRRYSLQWALDDYQSQLEPVVLDARDLEQYAGEYGAYRVTHEGGSLFYQRQNRGRILLIPMGNDCFRIDDQKDYSKYRVQFTKDSSGGIDGFFIHDSDGDKYPRATRSAH